MTGGRGKPIWIKWSDQKGLQEVQFLRLTRSTACLRASNNPSPARCGFDASHPRPATGDRKSFRRAAPSQGRRDRRQGDRSSRTRFREPMGAQMVRRKGWPRRPRPGRRRHPPHCDRARACGIVREGRQGSGRAGNENRHGPSKPRRHRPSAVVRCGQEYRESAPKKAIVVGGREVGTIPSNGDKKNRPDDRARRCIRFGNEAVSHGRGGQVPPTPRSRIVEGMPRSTAAILSPLFSSPPPRDAWPSWTLRPYVRLHEEEAHRPPARPACRCFEAVVQNRPSRWLIVGRGHEGEALATLPWSTSWRGGLQGRGP